MDRFAARVNLEVQWASEQTIAAVERNGGVITTAYFDIFCVNALSDPKRYFSLGHPVRMGGLWSVYTERGNIFMNGVLVPLNSFT